MSGSIAIGITALVLSLVSVVIALFALRASWRSAKASERSADAAERSAGSAEQTAVAAHEATEIQKHAYVDERAARLHIEHQWIELPRATTEVTGTQRGLEIEVRNEGQAPARDVRATFWGPDGQDQREWHPPPSAAVIAPGAVKYVMSGELPSEWLPDIGESRTYPVQIIYRDDNGPHSLELLFRLFRQEVSANTVALGLSIASEVLDNAPHEQNPGDTRSREAR